MYSKTLTTRSRHGRVQSCRRLWVFSLSCMGILLASCGNLRPLSPTHTVAVPPSRTPAATTTRAYAEAPSTVPARPLSPSATPDPSSLSPTATYDPSSLSTLTPSSPEKCPAVRSDAVVAVEFAQRLAEPVEQYLNDGGPPEQLLPLLGEQVLDADVSPSVVLQDLTNDGIPEVVVRAYESLVFGCQDGVFILLLKAGSEVGEALPVPWLDRVADMNANGMPELVLAYEFYGAGANSTLSVEIYEWDGVTFRSLIAKGFSGAPLAENGGGFGGVASMFNGVLALTDVDGNRTIELVMESYGAGGLDAVLNGGPDRSEIHVWMWNGIEFILEDVSFSAPTYRFEAVQDGDNASLLGDYDKAMSSYQDVIEDEELQGWNPARLGFDPLVGERTPEPTYPPVDPNERPRLEAYARFRMLLIELVLGRLDEAEDQVRILERDLDDQPSSSPFVELSLIAWQAYLESQDIGAACSLAIDYASSHPEEVLVPLGGAYYGWLNRDYEPDDICPFH